VLAYIQASGGTLPDTVLGTVAGHPTHLAYAAAFVCVLCPEPGESIAEVKADLEDQGYTVVVIQPDQEVASQLERYQFWRA
jgi:hypothetical protein